MQISQVYITDSDQELPPLLQEATETVKSHLPSTSYALYTNSMILDLIKSHFDDQVMAAYAKLIPYAYKADLAKYLILKTIGGWCIDISIKTQLFISTIPDHVDLIYFRDRGDGIFPGDLTYSVQNSLIFSARPNHPIFDEAIRLVTRHCLEGFYGLAPICPTGPSVFGRAIASFGNERSHVIGDFMPLTPNHPQKNRSYVLPNGQVLAIHKDVWFPDASPGDISKLGAEGGNNYIKLYRSGAIYNT